MKDDIYKNLSAILCHRFGRIAVEMEIITAEHLKEALSDQADDNLADKAHRLIGNILLDKGLMTEKQIEEVLEVLSVMEKEEE